MAKWGLFQKRKCPSAGGRRREPNRGTSVKGARLRNKKEQTVDTCNNLDGSRMHCMQGGKSASKDYLLYGSVYIIFLEGQSHTAGEQNRGDRGLRSEGEGDGKGMAPGSSRGDEKSTPCLWSCPHTALDSRISHQERGRKPGKSK